MVDALSISTGVAGFMSLAIEISKFLSSYSSSFKSAREDAQRLNTEIGYTVPCIEGAHTVSPKRRQQRYEWTIQEDIVSMLINRTLPIRDTEALQNVQQVSRRRQKHDGGTH
ncbi:hypothetical protein FPQ18DRAFT_308011 [Pyronema domesticum]|nr:hypothetical protein FPQ18DRAFT_308011 [Pyronema domesticum]